VKYSKSEIMNRAYKIPDLKFEDQNLISFAGLIIFQPFVAWVLKGGIVMILDKIEKRAEVGIAGMFGELFVAFR
jgi:hypothetical protein